jgi:hypothetical protein
MITLESIMQILTDEEKILLERYLKKRNDDFMNLCEARDRIIAMKKYHENKKDALISKLEKYNAEIQILSNEVTEKKLLL